MLILERLVNDQSGCFGRLFANEAPDRTLAYTGELGGDREDDTARSFSQRVGQGDYKLQLLTVKKQFCTRYQCTIGGEMLEFWNDKTGHNMLFIHEGYLATHSQACIIICVNTPLVSGRRDISRCKLELHSMFAAVSDGHNILTIKNRF